MTTCHASLSASQGSQPAALLSITAKGPTCGVAKTAHDKNELVITRSNAVCSIVQQLSKPVLRWSSRFGK